LLGFLYFFPKKEMTNKAKETTNIKNDVTFLGKFETFSDF